MQRIPFGLTCLLLLTSTGCWNSGDNEIVVYTALDQDFSEPIFDEFEQKTAGDIQARFDFESNKTVGLVNAIIAEKNHPQCDVFWNNEILHTLRLKKLGLLQECLIPAADSFPSDYRSADGMWYGFAARISGMKICQPARVKQSLNTLSPKLPTRMV